MGIVINVAAATLSGNCVPWPSDPAVSWATPLVSG